MRRLAQEVLLQRCDVEAFLVSSIQQVRAEMAAAAAGRGAAAAGTAALAHRQAPTPLPAQPQHQPPLAGEVEGSGAGDDEGPAGDAGPGAAGAEASSHTADTSTAGGSGGNSSGGSGGPVDIKHLSWEDRERILRLLFAKINRAAQVRLAAGGLGIGQAGLLPAAVPALLHFSQCSHAYCLMCTSLFAAPARAASCGADTGPVRGAGGGSRRAASPTAGPGN